MLTLFMDFRYHHQVTKIYKKTRLSLQKGVFLRPSIRRIGSLTNCPFKRYSLNELFVF
ncbi:methyltransferase [Enterococcus faecalis]|nr:methyltransferase [Enterococcus faecalis]